MRKVSKDLIMKILSTPGWEEYSLLDSGDGYRLEQFGKFRVARPDPQCIWFRKLDDKEWEKADAIFKKDQNGKEHWILNGKIPEKWLIRYKIFPFMPNSRRLSTPEFSRSSIFNGNGWKKRSKMKVQISKIQIKN